MFINIVIQMFLAYDQACLFMQHYELFLDPFFTDFNETPNFSQMIS
jgi:hypothetical protein